MLASRSKSIIEEENDDRFSRRPSSAKNARKKSYKSKNNSSSPPLPQPPDSVSIQPPSGRNHNKSPRKVSFLENQKILESTEEQLTISTIPVMKSVDASTSIDLNLTRLSRIHRFIQTDINSIEFNKVFNQLTELKKQLEVKDKIINENKFEESVCSHLFNSFYITGI